MYNCEGWGFALSVVTLLRKLKISLLKLNVILNSKCVWHIMRMKTNLTGYKAMEGRGDSRRTRGAREEALDSVAL